MSAGTGREIMDGCLAYYGVMVMRRAYCEIQPRDGGEDAKSNEV